MVECVIKSYEDSRVEFSYNLDRNNCIKGDASIQFVDNNSIYISTSTPLNFVRPKKNTDVVITVYKPNGLFTLKTKILDVDYSIEVVTYVLKNSTNWSLVQRRRTERYKVFLPAKIKFDGQESMETTIYTISTNSIACELRNILNANVIGSVCDILIQLPKEFLDGDNSEEMLVPARLIRQYNAKTGTLYGIFRYINLRPLQSIMLKNYIKSIKQ